MLAEFYRIARYIGAGLLNTGFGYCVYAGFVLAGAPLWLAVAGSTALGTVFNFMSYGGLVFGTTARRYLPRFLLFYACLGLFNYLALHMTERWNVGPLLSQALMLPVLMVVGYTGLRGFVFR